MKVLDSNGVTDLVLRLRNYFQDRLISGTNIKTVNNQSLLGSGNVSVQPTLVSGTNIKTINNQSLLGSGNITVSGGGSEQNIWYGESTTTAATQTKVVTTTSGDFTLVKGNMARVKFTNAQTYNGGVKLNVDGTGAVDCMRQGTTVTARYCWLAGEVIDFVYDGANFVAVNEGIATTTYYGTTKLSSSVTSTSTSLAATPSAVKQAYDLANSKQDGLVSGTNIKTINNQSLLGSGNIDISGGGGGGGVQTYTTTADAYSFISIGSTNIFGFEFDGHDETLINVWEHIISVEIGGNIYYPLVADQTNYLYIWDLNEQFEDGSTPEVTIRYVG